MLGWLYYARRATGSWQGKCPEYRAAPTDAACDESPGCDEPPGCPNSPSQPLTDVAFLREVEMNEFEQMEAASASLQPYRGEYPGRARRRIIAAIITGCVVVVLVVAAVLFVRMNDRIHHLDTTVATQSRQIHQLQTSLTTVKASLGAAVACLETVGPTQGLCSKLVK
jgi:hypothetical protein